MWACYAEPDSPTFGKTPFAPLPNPIALTRHVKAMSPSHVENNVTLKPSIIPQRGGVSETGDPTSAQGERKNPRTWRGTWKATSLSNPRSSSGLASTSRNANLSRQPPVDVKRARATRVRVQPVSATTQDKSARRTRTNHNCERPTVRANLLKTNLTKDQPAG